MTGEDCFITFWIQEVREKKEKLDYMEDQEKRDYLDYWVSAHKAKRVFLNS